MKHAVLRSSEFLGWSAACIRALCAFGTLALVAHAGAQTPAAPPRLVRASGEASVKAKPDHAEIRISVVSDSATAQGAAQANARQTTAVIDALKAALGKGGEVQTTDYSLSPQYQYGNNTPPKLTGYRASNTVLVEMDDIEGVGKIIDASVKVGANQVSGISFSLRDEQAVREQAIALATAKAKASAESIAKALGVKVAGVFEAETGSSGSSPIRPMPMMMRAMAQEAPTPVEAGTLDIRATVTVSLLIE